MGRFYFFAEVLLGILELMQWVSMVAMGLEIDK